MTLFTKKTSFDSSKCVSLLELTLQRIKILRSKKLIIAKQSRDDVAKLLQKGQDANAAARAEHIFREQNLAGAYDLLEQYCQLIIKRVRIIKSGKECPPELKEAIASLIYAAPRCGDLQELQKLRDLLTSKCGDESSSASLELKPEGSVNQQIIQKLSGRLPNSDTRLNLLKEIAREYKIDWNYQKAAASFENGEASMRDKHKVKGLMNQASKPIDVDMETPPAPAPFRGKEEVSTAAHIAIPVLPVNTRSETGEATDASRQPPSSASKGDGVDISHASAAAQSSRASTAHSNTPKLTEFVGASRKSSVGSPVITMESSWVQGTASRTTSSANSAQVPNGRTQESPERTELNKAKEHAASTGGLHDARVLSSKASSRSISDRLESDSIAESLAARQYMRARKNYIKAGAGAGEQDLKLMENPGTNVRAKHGTELLQVDPYVRLRREGRMDYKSSEGAPQNRWTSQSIEKEEDVSPHDYHGRDQRKATDYDDGEQNEVPRSQRGPKGLSHGDSSSFHLSEERIWREKNGYSSQARLPAEENRHRIPSTLPELVNRPAAARALAPSKRDERWADLEVSAETAWESAAHAADAARAAIDMVRLNFNRSQKIGHIEEGEPHVKTSLNSTVSDGSLVTEMLGMDAGGDNGRDKQENKSRYTEAYQEEESVFCGLERPHFDDYDSDESSEEEARFFTKRSAATVRKDDAHGDAFGSEGIYLSVKKQLEQDFSANLDNGGWRADQSLVFVSPKSSRNSLNYSARREANHSDYRQHQSDNAIEWTSAASKKSQYAGDRRNPQSATTNFGKQRRSLTAADGADTQTPPRATSRDHPAEEPQAHVGKYGGVSRRSVRSTSRLP